jgi:hypothetical protein
MEEGIAIYLAKASESLQTAESEFVNGRYNSCANRCYYCCFLAAIAALLREGIRPRGQWSHEFVHGQFVGVLINQRHPSVAGAAAQSPVRHRLPAERKCCPMRSEHPVRLIPRMAEAVQELKGVITARFPQASVVVEKGSDPKGVYLVTTVDIADTDEVIDLVGDRLVELQVEEGLPVYVTPLRPIERVAA